MVTEANFGWSGRAKPPPTAQPTITVNSEIHTITVQLTPTHEVSGNATDIVTGTEQADPAASGATTSATNAHTAENDVSAVATQTPSPQVITLEAGKSTWADADQPPVINLNPELAPGEDPITASPKGTPSAAPVTPGATPAPVTAPVSKIGGGQGSGLFKDLFSGTLFQAMPKDVGVSPAQHNPSSHADGGHADHPAGNFAGPDAHGAEVGHAGHIV